MYIIERTWTGLHNSPCMRWKCLDFANLLNQIVQVVEWRWNIRARTTGGSSEGSTLRSSIQVLELHLDLFYLIFEILNLGIFILWPGRNIWLVKSFKKVCRRGPLFVVWYVRFTTVLFKPLSGQYSILKGQTCYVR